MYRENHLPRNRKGHLHLLTLSLLFGISAFFISARVELLALTEMLPFPQEHVWGHELDIILLLVLTLEGLKGILVIADRYFSARYDEYVSESFLWMSRLAKIALFVLSASCSLALFSFYLIENRKEMLKEQRIEELSVWYSQRQSEIQAEWEPQLRKYDSLMEMERNIHAPNGDYVGFRYRKAEAEYDSARISKRQALEELEQKHEQNKKLVPISIEREKAYESPHLRALKRAVNQLGLGLTYEQTAYILSLLICFMIELTIYLAFAIASSLLIPENKPLKVNEMYDLP